MKLPIIVPRWSRVTLGMPRAPETRATMPYGLLVDLQRPARAGGCLEWTPVGRPDSNEIIGNLGNHGKY